MNINVGGCVSSQQKIVLFRSSSLYISTTRTCIYVLDWIACLPPFTFMSMVICLSADFQFVFSLLNRDLSLWPADVEILRNIEVHQLIVISFDEAAFDGFISIRISAMCVRRSCQRAMRTLNAFTESLNHRLVDSTEILAINADTLMDFNLQRMMFIHSWRSSTVNSGWSCICRIERTKIDGQTCRDNATQTISISCWFISILLINKRNYCERDVHYLIDVMKIRDQRPP